MKGSDQDAKLEANTFVGDIFFSKMEESTGFLDLGFRWPDSSFPFKGLDVFSLVPFLMILKYFKFPRVANRFTPPIICTYLHHPILFLHGWLAISYATAGRLCVQRLAISYFKMVPHWRWENWRIIHGYP